MERGRGSEGEGGGGRERERAHYTIKPPIDMTDALSPTHFDTFFEPPNLTFPVSMLSIRIASMLFTCCFEASILHSWPVCYLYVLPVCYLHAASKLRISQSSIPGEYAIYTYCQYAIYILLRSFEPPNLPFPASMLSIRIASMLFTCCFEPPNLPFLVGMLSICIAST